MAPLRPLASMAGAVAEGGDSAGVALALDATQRDHLPSLLRSLSPSPRCGEHSGDTRGGRSDRESPCH